MFISIFVFKNYDFFPRAKMFCVHSCPEHQPRIFQSKYLVFKLFTVNQGFQRNFYLRAIACHVISSKFHRIREQLHSIPRNGIPIGNPTVNILFIFQGIFGKTRKYRNYKIQRIKLLVCVLRWNLKNLSRGLNPPKSAKTPV